ncbi:MAG: hypothetical protein WCR56_07035 [Bacilli bacterium]
MNINNKHLCGLLVIASFVTLMTGCESNSSAISSVSSAPISEGTTTSSATVSDAEALVESVNFTVKPVVSYAPGDVFDITGMTVKVNLSNGHSKQYFDSDFSSWTHKDEALTEDVNKITFAIPDRVYSYFDLPITVSYADDINAVLIERVKFDQRYYSRSEHPDFRTYEVIDFTYLTVKIQMVGETDYIEVTNWNLFDGETEFTNNQFVWFETAGVHNLVVKYHNKASDVLALTVVENTSR